MSAVPPRPKGLTARELLRATNAIKSGESPAAVLLALQAREAAAGRPAPPRRAGSAPTTTLERSPRSSRITEGPAVTPAWPLSRRGTRVQAGGGGSASQPSDDAASTRTLLTDTERVRAGNGVQSRVRDVHNGIPEAVGTTVTLPRQRDMTASLTPSTDTKVVEAGEGIQRRVRDARGSLGAVEKKLDVPRQRDTGIPPRGDPSLRSQFALVHVSGIPSELEDEENLNAFFCRFGAVQAVHVQQERASKALWALVTFMDVRQAQAALDAASELNTQHPGLVVRKVEELPVPGLPELIRKRKATQCFTTDTQALMDMSMFAKAIGKGLVDPTDSYSDPAPADPATETASKSGCSCGPVCWPNCPHNTVHGDPTDFLRVRRLAKMTWAVAKIQARWRGITTRRKLSATKDSQAPPTNDGGMNPAQAERKDALTDLQGWLRQGPLLIEALGDSDPALKHVASVTLATVGALIANSSAGGK